MNFETFLFIIKNTFRCKIICYSDNTAIIIYNNKKYKFKYYNNFINCIDADAFLNSCTCSYDCNLEYISELSIIDYFISIVKANNNLFEFSYKESGVKKLWNTLTKKY